MRKPKNKEPKAKIVVDGEEVAPYEIATERLRGAIANREEAERLARLRAHQNTSTERVLRRTAEAMRARHGQCVYARTLFRRYTFEVWSKGEPNGSVLYRIEFYDGAPPRSFDFGVWLWRRRK